MKTVTRFPHRYTETEDCWIPLADAAYSFVKGHRIRVAASTTYWPLIWPSPEPVTLTLYGGKSVLELPVRPPRPQDKALKFKPVEAAEPVKRTVLAPGGRNRVVHTDMGKAETVVEVTDVSGRGRYDDIDHRRSALDRTLSHHRGRSIVVHGGSHLDLAIRAR